MTSGVGMPRPPPLPPDNKPLSAWVAFKVHDHTKIKSPGSKYVNSAHVPYFVVLCMESRIIYGFVVIYKVRQLHWGGAPMLTAKQNQDRSTLASTRVASPRVLICRNAVHAPVAWAPGAGAGGRAPALRVIPLHSSLYRVCHPLCSGAPVHVRVYHSTEAMNASVLREGVCLTKPGNWAGMECVGSIFSMR